MRKTVSSYVAGYNAVRALGLAPDPPRGLCARLVARMFPDQNVDGLDPWGALRWCTGRADLPTHPKRDGWTWRSAPLDA